jgi:hypothetical protein
MPAVNIAAMPAVNTAAHVVVRTTATAAAPRFVMCENNRD